MIKPSRYLMLAMLMLAALLGSGVSSGLHDGALARDEPECTATVQPGESIQAESDGAQESFSKLGEDGKSATDAKNGKEMQTFAAFGFLATFKAIDEEFVLEEAMAKGFVGFINQSENISMGSIIQNIVHYVNENRAELEKSELKSGVIEIMEGQLRDDAALIRNSAQFIGRDGVPVPFEKIYTQYSANQDTIHSMIKWGNNVDPISDDIMRGIEFLIVATTDAIARGFSITIAEIKAHYAGEVAATEGISFEPLEIEGEGEVPAEDIAESILNAMQASASAVTDPFSARDRTRSQFEIFKDEVEEILWGNMLIIRRVPIPFEEIYGRYTNYRDMIHKMLAEYWQSHSTAIPEHVQAGIELLVVARADAIAQEVYIEIPEIRARYAEGVASEAGISFAPVENEIGEQVPVESIAAEVLNTMESDTRTVTDPFDNAEKTPFRMFSDLVTRILRGNAAIIPAIANKVAEELVYGGSLCRELGEAGVEVDCSLLKPESQTGTQKLDLPLLALAVLAIVLVGAVLIWASGG